MSKSWFDVIVNLLAVSSTSSFPLYQVKLGAGKPRAEHMKLVSLLSVTEIETFPIGKSIADGAEILNVKMALMESN